MSLLSKEQQETLERIRKAPFDPAASYDHLCTTIAFIDDLQARAPKQYTEQELREHYENCFSAETGEDNTWDGWRECAKFVGALKAEP